MASARRHSSSSAPRPPTPPSPTSYLPSLPRQSLAIMSRLSTDQVTPDVLPMNNTRRSYDSMINRPAMTPKEPSTLIIQTPSPPPSPQESPTSHSIDLEASTPMPGSSIPIPMRSSAIAGFPSPISEEEDPLLLRDRLRSDEDIQRLRRRGGGATFPSKKNRRLDAMATFYEGQNEHIRGLLKPLNVHAEEARDAEGANRLKVKIAVTGSLVINILLAVIQIYAAVSSLSLSFFATAIDAIFDPCANLILGYAHRKAEKVDLNKYPSGGARFETIGNIVYSFVMGSVSVILIVESIQSLASGHGDGDGKLHVPSIIAVSVAFATKLAAFLYCFPLRDINKVRVLWEDHRNDLLINGFGIFTSAAGAKIAWWIDPLGAIIISVVLILLWGSTCVEQFGHLAGKSAPSEFLQLVIYKAMTFSDEIKQIDACRAYHSGENYVVEVDVVMPSETPLWKAHDVSQDLQDQLETLPKVERAFVHVDHETQHRPEHRKYT